MKSLSMDILGAEFTELTEEQKKKMEVNYGVQVSKLKNGKLKEAGITEKFIILKVNNQNIKSVGDLETVFRIAQVVYISDAPRKKMGTV
jgi:S1-C subfamily serine protease